jgi:hypothetical protein
MSKVTIDDAFGNTLGQFKVPVELCDRTGRTLGRFIPEGVAWQAVLADDRCPYSLQELARMQQETGGRQLSEIWSSLGRL